MGFLHHSFCNITMHLLRQPKQLRLSLFWGLFATAAVAVYISTVLQVITYPLLHDCSQLPSTYIQQHALSHYLRLRTSLDIGYDDVSLMFSMEHIFALLHSPWLHVPHLDTKQLLLIFSFLFSMVG